MAGERDQRLDDAARAAWLYYIAGNTQDGIAAKLDVSRQVAQRLVSLAVAERLIKFRLDHPIAACMELGERLREAFVLEFCDVVPTDPAMPESVAGTAIAAAARLERLLAGRAPLIVCVGTGRTLRAMVEEVAPMERPQHKIVSLVGSMSSSGAASRFDVLTRLADRTGSQRFPMPTPVVAESVEERRLLQGQRAFRTLRELREQARASFVGVSGLGWGAPLHKDGFVTDAEVTDLLERGAVGEITGWAFDAEGRVVGDSVNERVASLPLERPPRRATVAVAAGHGKAAALRAALHGRLVSGLITDEATAGAILGG